MAVTSDTDVPVIGDGECGLTSAIVLSNLAVNDVLVGRRPGTATWPNDGGVPTARPRRCHPNRATVT